MESIWVVVDINGGLYGGERSFTSREECVEYITEKLDSADDREKGRDSMYKPVEVKAFQQSDYWVIVDNNGTLAAEHGFFASHTKATDYIEARLDPPADREYGRPATYFASQVTMKKPASTEGAARGR